MQFGYDDEPDWDGSHPGWGKGSPIKVGGWISKRLFELTVQWDRAAFWRIVPHKHVRSRHIYPTIQETVFGQKPVNSQCDRCYRWFVLATGKLHPTYNKENK